MDNRYSGQVVEDLAFLIKWEMSDLSGTRIIISKIHIRIMVCQMILLIKRACTGLQDQKVNFRIPMELRELNSIVMMALIGLSRIMVRRYMAMQIGILIQILLNQQYFVNNQIIAHHF